MHFYGGITPQNVWDIDMDVLRMLVDSAKHANSPTREAGG